MIPCALIPAPPPAAPFNSNVPLANASQYFKLWSATFALCCPAMLYASHASPLPSADIQSMSNGLPPVKRSGPEGVNISICGLADKTPDGSDTGEDHVWPWSDDFTFINGLCWWSGQPSPPSVR